RDDVRMGELSDGARLAAKALELVRLVGDLAVQELDRDPALERLVASEINGRHPAAAQLGFESVAAGEQSAGEVAAKLGCRFVRHSPTIFDNRARTRLQVPRWAVAFTPERPGVRLTSTRWASSSASTRTRRAP